MPWHDRWPAQRRRDETGGLSWKEFVAACRAAGIRCRDQRIREALVEAGLRTRAAPGPAGYTAEMIEAVRAYTGRSGTKAK
jgi:hypothetical protein